LFRLIFIALQNVGVISDVRCTSFNEPITYQGSLFPAVKPGTGSLSWHCCTTR